MDLARLSLEIDSSQARRAKDDVSRFGSAAAEAETKSKKATSAISMGMARAAGGVLGLVAASVSLTSAITTVSEFESSMSKVAAVSRATSAELAQMRDVARELGSTTEFSASQAASGLNFLAMAGFSASESIAAMPDVLDLATAAALDLGEAADISSNIMSAFAIPAENAASVADILAAAASRANTDVGQLGEAMKYVGPVAAAMGVEMDDAAAAIGVLSDAGIQGSMAGTGLRRVMSSLANPTGEAASAIRRLQLNAEDLNPATNSLVDIVDRLAGSGLDAADALTIFGDRGGPAILALTSQTDSLRELTGELSNVEGEAKRMADTMRDNLGGDIKGLWSAIEGLVIAVGDTGLTGSLRGLVQELTTVIRFFGQVAGAVGAVVDAYRRVATEGYAVRQAIEEKTAAMREELKLIGDVSTGLDLAGASTADAVRLKILETTARRDNLQAMIDERRELALTSVEYRENAEAIAQVERQIQNAHEGMRMAGDLGDTPRANEMFERYALALGDSILDLSRLKAEQEEILGLNAVEIEQRDLVTQQIENTQAALEAVTSGQDTFNGRIIEGNTFSERLASALGAVSSETDAAAGSASALAGALAGANSQAASLIANMGMVPAAMSGLAGDVADLTISLGKQNDALSMQIENGTDARIAGLKAERNALIDKMDAEGADIMMMADQVLNMDLAIDRAEDLANKNNTLTDSLREKQAAEARAAAEAARAAAGALGSASGGGRSARGGGSGGGGAVAQVEQMNDAQREAERIYEQTRTSAERYAAELADLNELYRMGYLDAETYDRAVDKLGETMDRAGEFNLASEVGDLSESLVNAAMRGENLGDVMASTFQRIAADLASSRLQAAIDGLMGSIGGGGGDGWFSSIGSALFGGKRKHGGAVNAGQAYVVGEDRAELFVPRTSGTILPKVPEGGGGAPSITIINNAGASVSAEPTPDGLGVQVMVERAVSGYMSGPKGQRMMRNSYGVKPVTGGR